MITAAVLVAHGSEDLETVTIIDILRRASIKVSVLAVFEEEHSSPSLTIELAHGIKILADSTLSSPNEYDLVVLPGGLRGAHTFQKSPKVQQLLQNQLKSPNKWTGAICAAPLAVVGLLGKGNGSPRVTGYPALKEAIKAAANDPGLVFEEAQAVVVWERLVTSQGPATAIPFALELVRQVKGGEIADRLSQDLLFTQ